MKIRTEKKTETKTTKTHVAELKFDTMKVSPARFERMAAAELFEGQTIEFNLEKGKYIMDEVVILLRNGKLVATVVLEE